MINILNIVCDIDGVLTDYPKCYSEYINIVTNNRHINEGSIKDIKEHYRTSGYKRVLPVLKNNVNTLRSLYSRKHLIYLITSRPVEQYPIIKEDTLYWLEKNIVPYSNIFWTADKASLVSRYFSSDNCVCIDDEYENANAYACKGYTAFLISNNENKGMMKLNKHDNVFWINNLDDMCYYLGVKVGLYG